MHVNGIQHEIQHPTTKKGVKLKEIETLSTCLKKMTHDVDLPLLTTTD